MPNLFSLRPVVIFAWVWASTSGLTRKADHRRRPRESATSFKPSSSGSRFDIDLQNAGIDGELPVRARVLPTPEKTMCSGGMPAARARRNSPSETTSAPAPKTPRVRITAMLELALTAITDGGVETGHGVGEDAEMAVPGWRWNSNRRVFRPSPPDGRSARLRHAAARRDSRNGSLRRPPRRPAGRVGSAAEPIAMRFPDPGERIGARGRWCWADWRSAGPASRAPAWSRDRYSCRPP